MKNYKIVTFSDGAKHVQLTESQMKMRYPVIDVSETEDFDPMELALLVNAYDEAKQAVLLTINIPRLMYARQDRVCSPGQANALRTFIKMLQTSIISVKLVTEAVHNEDAVKKYMVETRQSNCFSQPLTLQNKKLHELFPPQEEECVIVAPDKGARNQVEEVALSQDKPLVCFNKVRDPKTGNINSIDLLNEEDRNKIKDQHCIIVDDLCDNGGTFLGIAAKLREYGAAEVSIYVRHWVNPNGILNMEKHDISIIKQ